MHPGIWNIVFGALFTAAGLSGRFSLRFTDSQWPLVGVGLVIFAVGVGQFVAHRRRRAG